MSPKYTSPSYKPYESHCSFQSCLRVHFSIAHAVWEDLTSSNFQDSWGYQNLEFISWVNLYQLQVVEYFLSSAYPTAKLIFIAALVFSNSYLRWTLYVLKSCESLHCIWIMEKTLTDSSTSNVEMKTTFTINIQSCVFNVMNESLWSTLERAEKITKKRKPGPVSVGFPWQWKGKESRRKRRP